MTSAFIHKSSQMQAQIITASAGGKKMTVRNGKMSQPSTMTHAFSLTFTIFNIGKIEICSGVSIAGLPGRALTLIHQCRHGDGVQ